MITQNEFSIVNLEPKQAITIRDHCPASELSKKYDELFNKINESMKEQSLEYSSAPFGIYHDYSPEDVDVEVGIPVAGNPNPIGRVNVIQTYGGKAVKLKFYGPYSKLHEAWNSLMEHVRVNNYQMSDSPFEVYVTDPRSEPDPSKLLTELYCPIK